MPYDTVQMIYMDGLVTPTVQDRSRTSVHTACVHVAAKQKVMIMVLHPWINKIKNIALPMRPLLSSCIHAANNIIIQGYNIED